jgi:hypothetical protein
LDVKGVVDARETLIQLGTYTLVSPVALLKRRDRRKVETHQVRWNLCRTEAIGQNRSSRANMHRVFGTCRVGEQTKPFTMLP